MQQNFSAEFFTDNRTRLRERLKDEVPIVVTAHGQLQASSDNAYPFKQDANFWYLTGIDFPDVTLVVTKDETYLIAPTRSAVQDLFDGSADLSDLRQTSGINTVLGQDEGWARLKADLQEGRRVHTPQANPAYIPVYGMYTNPARARLVRRMKHAVPKLEILDIRSELASLRVIKQAPEIDAIRRAIDITCSTLNDVRQRSYGYEYELEADISHGFRSRGANGHAFPPIVAGGINACTLHYLTNDMPLNKADLILCDVGTEYGHYPADLTRTWSLSKPSSRQQAVFNAVDEAVAFGIEQLKPGERFYDCEQRIRTFVGKKLKQLGLLQDINKEGIFRYYPHAPHYLGLDVHDVGDTKQSMEPGMVLTIEPGIYVPDEGIGVRLEEDLLITKSGCELLSKSCPRALTSVQ